jgi:CHAT domain
MKSGRESDVPILTIQQLKKIVRDCLRIVTGSIRNVSEGQRLVTLGIDSRAKLRRFKLMIVREFSKLNYKIALTDLAFGQDAPIEIVYRVLLSKNRAARKVLESLKWWTGHAPFPTHARPSDSKLKAKHAKKKTAKRIAKKAKPKITNERGIEDSAYYGVVSTTKETKPAKQKGAKKDILRKSPRETGVIGREYLPGDASFGIEDLEVKFEEEELEVGADESEPTSHLNALPSPTRTIEGTPQMEICRELIPKKSYRMGVLVNQGPAAEGAEVKKVSVEVSRDLREFSLDVWLDCSSHFQLEDVSDPSRITVNADTGVSDELGFTCNVLKGPDESPMYVSAFFRYNGRPSGKITRYLEAAEGVLRWKKFLPTRELEGEVVLPNADTVPFVVADTQGIPADIRVEVLRGKANNGKDFNLRCYTQQGKWEGDWNLPTVSKELVNTYMKNFMADKGEARIASLEGAGMDFWDALPDDKLRELLWEALEKGAHTMSVISEEPYIPWELIVPYREVQNPRKPLGIELQIGRWITGNYQAARQKISLKSGYIICPKTSGLAAAAQEVTFLTQQLQPQFNPVDEVVPASFSGVNKSLSAGPRNVIHFMCHGKTAALQTLELDSPDTLNCSQVRRLQGFIAAFKDGPLAFLNACEVGGQVLALDGVGGFANSFIQLGASAVIAPLWAVQDKVALDVTQTFYPQAFKGVPFAAAMKQIRAKAYAQAIDSYAAYCFYGDPMASLA